MSEFTGRKMAITMVSFFGVIIAVNFLMAYKAVSTFPGLEVKNSYVASQQFDTIRAAQKDLGWTMTPDYDNAEGRLYLAFTDANGQPAMLTDLSVLVGRSTIARDDQTPEFVNAAGLWTAPINLEPGKWLLRVDARAADGTLFSQRVGITVKG
ncbi:MAG: FixH family protein [Pseudotabrizicola sp.]|uniref:FixH family protein n=1 Tax=Pseudotabrizicola sp. TaxID=2939647 RepID=UPI00272091F5|nr:FixH family protein [Pseudotabrizicola sp.]MDO8882094.1 FixH family protein [Pseudotabrizicola sp.]MDP2082257.1 FixH family protein [Pseudotabrizicola sp.]MDZ7575177.1 FixH family protein [Pseudotabrizicola sp.]